MKSLNIYFLSYIILYEYLVNFIDCCCNSLYIIFTQIRIYLTTIYKKNPLEECKVPTLNMEQCFWSQYQECPRYNGSYQQCTNNYIPKPNTGNCECNNRTFAMCPDPYKISEKCYYNSI